MSEKMIPLASMEEIKEEDVVVGKVFSREDEAEWKEIVKNNGLSQESSDVDIAEGFIAFVLFWQGCNGTHFEIFKPDDRRRGHDVFKCKKTNKLYKYKGELWKKLNKTYCAFLS